MNTISILPVLEQVRREIRLLEPTSPGTGPRMRLRGSGGAQEASGAISPSNAPTAFRSGIEPLAKMVGETNRMISSQYRAMALSFRDMTRILDRIRKNTSSLRPSTNKNKDSSDIEVAKKSVSESALVVATSPEQEASGSDKAVPSNAAPQNTIQKQLKEQMAERKEPKLKTSTGFFGINTNLLAILQYMKIVENDRWEQTQHILLNVMGMSKRIDKIGDKIETITPGMKVDEKKSDGLLSSLFVGAMGWLGKTVGQLGSLLGDAGKAISGFMESVGGLSGMFTSLMRYGTVLARGGAIPVAIAAGLAYITWGAIEAKSIIDDIANLRSDTQKMRTNFANQLDQQEVVVAARKTEAIETGDIEGVKTEIMNEAQIKVMRISDDIQRKEEQLSRTPKFKVYSAMGGFVESSEISEQYAALEKQIADSKQKMNELNEKATKASSKKSSSEYFYDRAFSKSLMSQMPSRVPPNVVAPDRQRSIAPPQKNPWFDDKQMSDASAKTTINAPVITANSTNNSTQTIAPTMFRPADRQLLDYMIG